MTVSFRRGYDAMVRDLTVLANQEFLSAFSYEEVKTEHAKMLEECHGDSKKTVLPFDALCDIRSKVLGRKRSRKNRLKTQTLAGTRKVSFPGFVSGFTACWIVDRVNQKKKQDARTEVVVFAKARPSIGEFDDLPRGEDPVAVLGSTQVETNAAFLAVEIGRQRRSMGLDFAVKYAPALTAAAALKGCY